MSYLKIIYTSAEDAKSSLTHIADVKMLRRALRKLRTMEQSATKIKHIGQRIHQLVGCRYRNCKKRATTVHCKWCNIRVCKDHKGPGNHGGLKGEINHERTDRS